MGITDNSLAWRWGMHVSQSPALSNKFHAAIQQYGVTDFDPIVLFSYSTRAEALLAEAALIEALSLMEVGYNTLPGGGALLPHTEASRAKISIAQKGRIRTPEWRANHSATMTGRRASEATREKLRMRKHTPARRAKFATTMNAIWGSDTLFPTVAVGKLRSEVAARIDNIYVGL